MFLTGTDTAATGKTVAVTLSKNGATSFSNPNAGASNATEMASGWYKFAPAAADRDTEGPLVWRFTNADCDPGEPVELVVDNVRLGITALPNAAADAAGGLPISDAGGLDLDAKLANTNEVTAARMGALTDWINGGRLDLILDDILLDTGTTLQGELDGIQADTEDIQSKIGTPVVTLAADLAAIEAQTDDIGAAGAGLSAVPWNAAWDAEVQSEVTDALNAYDPPTKAELDSAFDDRGITTADGVDRIAGKNLQDAGTGGYLIGGP